MYATLCLHFDFKVMGDHHKIPCERRAFEYVDDGNFS